MGVLRKRNSVSKAVSSHRTLLFEKGVKGVSDLSLIPKRNILVIHLLDTNRVEFFNRVEFSENRVFCVVMFVCVLLFLFSVLRRGFFSSLSLSLTHTEF